MKLSMLMGRLKASQSLSLFENNGNFDATRFHVVNSRIGTIRGIILKSFPSEAGLLDAAIEDTILESQEFSERRIERNYRPTNAFFDAKSVINLSQTAIPEDVLLGLSFGPKFVFPQKADLTNVINIITVCSCSFDRNLPVVTNNEAYKQASIQLGAYILKYRDDKEIWLLFLQYRIKKFLSSHEGLLITRSDKGKHTIIIERKLYMEKMLQLVSTADYSLLANIDLFELESINNKFIDRLKALHVGKVPRKDSCTLIAQMYGLIKVHKDTLPIRPITSACGSPGFKLAAFLTDVLNEVFPEKGFHVRNSLEVKHMLDGVELLSDEEIVSFDVVSMFTNITIDLMLDIISERRDLLHKLFAIPWDLFVEIMNFVLRDCAVFSLNESFYKQNDSLAMGSPLSPILAKILMSKILDYTLEYYNKKPKLVALYVDDSLWILPKNDTNLILERLNSFHQRISFTIEREKNDSISFLDIEVCRRNNKIITCWFKKHFASLRILNWFSNHSHSCITQTAVSFIKMVFNLSHDDFFLKNRDILIEMLRCNSFPEDVSIRLMHENYTLMRPVTYKSVKASYSYAPIPFQPGFAGPLKGRMRSLHPNFLLTSIPDRSTTNHFSYLKDKISVESKTNILLLLECACGRYIDVRKTKYSERASSIINFCKITFDTSDGQCVGHCHKMNKWRFFRCKNHDILVQKYNAFLHVNRHRLQYPTHSLTHFRFKKHLDFVNNRPN